MNGRAVMKYAHDVREPGRTKEKAKQTSQTLHRVKPVVEGVNMGYESGAPSVPSHVNTTPTAPRKRL